MSEYEATGRTVDEAVESALSSLGIRRENAIISVIEEPSQGLLGILGNKQAKVLVKSATAPEDYLEKYLSELLEKMEIKGAVEVSSNEEKVEAMISGDDVGILIGRRGRTLSDLQYLINIIMRRQFSGLNKITVIDVEHYREKREKTLTQLAKNVARKVSADGYEQSLEPMNPQERRIIHIALQEHPEVTTRSDGQEPYRKGIITPR
jgi:spoIIIJ-associated protein